MALQAQAAALVNPANTAGGPDTRPTPTRPRADAETTQEPHRCKGTGKTSQPLGSI